MDFIIILISFETQLLIDLFILKYYRLQWPIILDLRYFNQKIFQMQKYVMNTSLYTEENEYLKIVVYIYILYNIISL